MNLTALVATCETSEVVLNALTSLMEGQVSHTARKIHTPQYHIDEAASCLRQAVQELKRAATRAAIMIEDEQIASEAARGRAA